MDEQALEALEARAYDAWDDGRMEDAGRLFDDLLRALADAPHLHYMRGLVHKYRFEWADSLAHNLRALELRAAAGETGDVDQASVWNAAIAATGAGDWMQARRLWALAGIAVPGTDGPIEGDFGAACVRLNPWGDGETVWFRRLSPCHGRLLNVPMPESGFRFGDIVLHDGARTGTRSDGTRDVPVFNAMQRLQASEFATFTVLAHCDDEADVDALGEIRLPGLGYVEDWTGSFRVLCRRCSYGTPHSHGEHDQDDDGAWQHERDFGVAAQGRAVVDAVLERWLAGGRGGRRVDAIERRDHPLVPPAEGVTWWLGPDEDDEDEDGRDVTG